MLSLIVKKRFCSGTPYHHNFHPGKFEKSPLDFGLALFEFGRICFYVYFTFKVTTHSFSLITFRKKNFLNNPDYLLCDQETYARLKVAQTLPKN